MKDGEALDGLLNHFINYIRPEVKDFRTAIEAFKVTVQGGRNGCGAGTKSC